MKSLQMNSRRFPLATVLCFLRLPKYSPVSRPVVVNLWVAFHYIGTKDSPLKGSGHYMNDPLASTIKTKSVLTVPYGSHNTQQLSP
jgi:hypothetical protein